MKQAGEGCDYTIGCGERLVKVECETFVGALAKVPGILEHYGFGSSDEVEPAECKLLREVANLMPEVVLLTAKHQEAKANEEREGKLRELERLKRELGVK